MLGISVHDWVSILLEIVVEFKEAVVNNIPGRVWVFVILAVGINLLAQNYPEKFNLTEYPEAQPPLVKVENADFNKENLSDPTGAP